MRVLIVGCGYIGLPLGVALLRQGHDVFGLRRSAEKRAELKEAGITLLTGDITKAADLERLPAQYDWVVNCVASGGGGPQDYRAVYWQGTRNLIDWLSPMPPQRFVYTSSTSVYGQTDGITVTESSPTEPATATGRILVETEGLLLEAARRHGFPATILRLAGIYGPGRGYWLRQYLSGQATIEGAGGRILNMIHRDDVVGALLAALERGRAGEVYNVADDEPTTQLALYRWLAQKSGGALPPSVPESADSTRKRGFTNKRVSNRKLKEDLGYRLKYRSFREGFAAEARDGKWQMANGQ